MCGVWISGLCRLALTRNDGYSKLIIHFKKVELCLLPILVFRVTSYDAEIAKGISCFFGVVENHRPMIQVGFELTGVKLAAVANGGFFTVDPFWAL